MAVVDLMKQLPLPRRFIDDIEIYWAPTPDGIKMFFLDDNGKRFKVENIETVSSCSPLEYVKTPCVTTIEFEPSPVAPQVKEWKPVVSGLAGLNLCGWIEKEDCSFRMDAGKE